MRSSVAQNSALHLKRDGPSTTSGDCSGSSRPDALRKQRGEGQTFVEQLSCAWIFKKAEGDYPLEFSWFEYPATELRAA
jgi:hypothetical protein